MDITDTINGLIVQAGYPSPMDARIVLGWRSYAAEVLGAWECEAAAGLPLSVRRQCFYYPLELDEKANPDEVRLEIGD